ncbi:MULTISPECIES: polysaccharide pyruvyl transferase family protein [Croceibacter]|uniref:polysaccharide pyruvyl transferase family protein n=1 Tax=Croceibacter TaxID=216431 RepID=UPI000C650E84|nr:MULTISPECIES: polysaccharide pyruvyl transferase family protein [Croceibacter]MBG24876.1 hypothetical protein [Croceibacter sp.]|tara:strand:+ start:3395 stop:4297 length:903 start_codon:yes stop_codon:yes gene_type:complete
MSIQQRIKKKIREVKQNLFENVKYTFFNNIILVGGYSHSINFGDALNVFLVESLSKKKVIHSKYIRSNYKELPRYQVIGSVLQWSRDNDVVWGSGLIKKSSLVPAHKLDIRAVRGPNTLSILEHNQIVSKEADIAFGDPALLLPMLYDNKIDKKYKIGIIPHYVDNMNPWLNKVASEELKVIDIECGTKWKSFVNDVLSCDMILSTSLHGLVIADAYRIPSLWIGLSDKLEGGNFKFDDYYMSIGEKNINRIVINLETKVKDLIPLVTLKKQFNGQEQLIVSCPFIDESVKSELLSKIGK